MCFWLIIVLIILVDLGVFTRSKFVAFGPRDDLMFMHVCIDTYYKYYMLIAMIIFHTFITDLIADSLVPHVLNVVQDTKNRYIPHKARTYLLITTAWSIYCSVTQLFVIFIAFGQLDLLLVRLASDLFANFFTLSMYLDGKIYDPDLHAKNLVHPVRKGTGHYNSNNINHGNKNPHCIYTINDDEEEEEGAVEMDDIGSSSRTSKTNSTEKETFYFKKASVASGKNDQGEEQVDLIFEDPIPAPVIDDNTSSICEINEEEDSDHDHLGDISKKNKKNKKLDVEKVALLTREKK
jgi:hypothetical protein